MSKLEQVVKQVVRATELAVKDKEHGPLILGALATAGMGVALMYGAAAVGSEKQINAFDEDGKKTKLLADREVKQVVLIGLGIAVASTALAVGVVVHHYQTKQKLQSVPSDQPAAEDRPAEAA